MSGTVRGKHASKRGTATPGSDSAAGALERLVSGRAIWAVLALAALLFYAAPLAQEHVTIQWDAADYHYSAQKYFADRIITGKLPHWTPYPFSGMPFLADVQVGAWYPLNWPFFIFGITPRAIEGELALHCLLACAGAFLLARQLLGNAVSGLFAAVLYAFGGFFAAHSSHVGMFQSAALLPWLLWTGLLSVRNLRWLPAVGALAASIVLAGYFQSALYAITAFGLFLIAHGIRNRAAWPRIALVLGCTAVLTLALTAIQVLPGLELTAQSNRATVDFSRGANSTLVPGALLTLINPDHYGAPEVENYSGPEDITQFYFYQGLLLLPLAAFGLWQGKARLYALTLAVPALCYAFGPAAGFYLLVARLPGFRSIRAPVHVWFVVALGLSILAASGVAALCRRYPRPWVALALLAVIGGDLWYWNMDRNEMAYGRASFAEHYGRFQDEFVRVATHAITSPVYRLWAPFDPRTFGQLNAMLDSGIEVTYGYNPLTLSRYAAYVKAAETNPRLLDSLAVTARLNVNTGVFEPNASAMPRVTAPPSVVTVRSREEALARVVSLDPAKQSVVEGGVVEGGTAMENVPVQVRITGYTGDEYHIAYRADRPAFLRIAVPYFPGWRAEAAGRSLPVVPTDLALSGVTVPAGTGELIFRYQSNWFGTGAAISGIAWAAVLVWFCWGLRKRQAVPPGLDQTPRMDLPKR